MRPTIDQVHQMLAQTARGARRCPPFRPIRLVFATADGVRAFEVPRRGTIGFSREAQRFHVAGAGGGVERYYFDELIDAGFLDEMDAHGDARAAS